MHPIIRPLNLICFAFALVAVARGVFAGTTGWTIAGVLVAVPFALALASLQRPNSVLLATLAIAANALGAGIVAAFVATIVAGNDAPTSPFFVIVLGALALPPLFNTGMLVAMRRRDSRASAPPQKP